MIIGLFAGSVVLLGGWRQSARRAPKAVLPLRLFRNRVFSVSAGISIAARFARFEDADRNLITAEPTGTSSAGQG